MDAKKFLETWKRLRKEELRTDCICCINRDRSIEKRGMCVCNSEENLVDCMIRYIDEVEKMAKENKRIELTERQKTAIRGRIAEGYLWVAKDKDGTIWFFEKEPQKETEKGSHFVYLMPGECQTQMCHMKVAKIYNFVTFENSPLYLPDLLEGEE